jgi:hypothetical protein
MLHGGYVLAVDMLVGARILVNGLEATNVSFWNTSADAPVRVLFFPPFNFSYEGYASLTVMNPDGGVGVERDIMYFSEDCPQVGLVGRGTSCRQCPSGAFCPGGNRIWPSAGWCVRVLLLFLRLGCNLCLPRWFPDARA